MENLNDAEVLVETRLSLNSGEPYGIWFRLSDYSNIGEFFVDCAAWFALEENPEYEYVDWENIPDGMINRVWISPNLFELREALQRIEESCLSTFWNWCMMYGWDTATDEPDKIVFDFMESADCTPTFDDEQPDCDEPEYYFLLDGTGKSFEIFNDNYN